MATVTAEITLTSAAGDLTTDALALSTSKATTITDMATTGLARAKVQATAVHATATVLYTADDFAAPAYIYIKNTGDTNTAAFGIVSSARIDVDDDLTSLAYDATPLQPDDATANGTGLSEVTGKNFRTFSLKPGEFVFMPFDYLGDLYGEAIDGTTTLEIWRFDRGA